MPTTSDNKISNQIRKLSVSIPIMEGNSNEAKRLRHMRRVSMSVGGDIESLKQLQSLRFYKKSTIESMRMKTDGRISTYSAQISKLKESVEELQ